MDIETLLINYSEFLERHGYTDSDWRDEKPFAPVSFLEGNPSIRDERVVPTLATTTNRLVVVDHRTKHDRLENFGRIIDAWDVKIELDLQDDNRTLKVFITD